MPELPEVETIRQQLLPYLPLQVQKVQQSRHIKSILKFKEFEPQGKKIIAIERIGKVLNFHFEEGWHLLSQLGMSGGWRISKEPIAEKHNHFQLECMSRGQRYYLAYVDPRRFGNIYLFNRENAQKKLSSQGVDISTSAFTAEYVYSVFKRFPNKQIKPLLLEQKYFAGVGNYIACEICARAGIRPTRRVSKITPIECQEIITATVQVLEGSLRRNGMTFHGGYVDASGSKGEGVQNLVVFYQKICGLCKKTAVKKITLAGRGTYYCPKCQS